MYTGDEFFPCNLWFVSPNRFRSAIAMVFRMVPLQMSNIMQLEYEEKRGQLEIVTSHFAPLSTRPTNLPEVGRVTVWTTNSEQF